MVHPVTINTPELLLADNLEQAATSHKLSIWGCSVVQNQLCGEDAWCMDAITASTMPHIPTL